MSELSQQAIASFLEQLAHLVGQSINLPDFGDLVDVDDEQAGPGLVRASPDDIEAAVVMGLQRAALEQERAAEEERLVRQTEIIAAAKTRADAPPALPGNSQLFLVEEAAITPAVEGVEAGREAGAQLTEEWGKSDAEFEAATDQAMATLDARDREIAALHQAIATTLADRREKVEAQKAALGQEKATMAPESQRVIAAATKKGAAWNLRDALAAADASLNALDDALDVATGVEFSRLLVDAENKTKQLPSFIRNVNTMAQDQRKTDRKVKIADAGFKPIRIPASELAILVPGADKAFATAIGAHEAEHKKLAALPINTAAGEFDNAWNAVRDLRDDAEAELLTLRSAVDKEKKARQVISAAVFTDSEKLPASVAKPGTDEFKALDVLQKQLTAAIRGLARLVGAEPRAKFDDEERKARDLLDAVRAEINAADTGAGLRQQRMDALVDALKQHAQSVNAQLPPPNYLSNNSINAAARKALNQVSREALKKITGIDDAADLKEDQRFREYTAKAIEFGNEVKRVRPIDFTAVANNKAVLAQIDLVTAALGKQGIGDTAIASAKPLANLVRDIKHEYDLITGLAARVATARTTPDILPQNQLILNNYAAHSAVAALDQLEKQQLRDRTTQYSVAVREVEEKIADNVAEADFNASDAGVFVTNYKINRSTNQPQVLTDLNALLNNGTAVVQPGRDVYQCEGEKNHNFSIERELRIGGRPGVLIHAHCTSNGTVKHGNGFHIKLTADKHLKGRGVMLSGAPRATLLAEFVGNDNLDAKDAAPISWS